MKSTLEPLKLSPVAACARHAKGAGGALAVGVDLRRLPALPSQLDLVRATGAGGAFAVGAALVDFPRFHRSSTSSVRPSGHLTVGLLGSSQAFNGAVRNKFHCSDCLECVGEVANHP